MRSTLSKARVVLATGAVEESKESVMVAISSLDRAVTKGILHKNNAARRKSRLMKRLAALAK
jgi:small subunit ribosomal protein S20